MPGAREAVGVAMAVSGSAAVCPGSRMIEGVQHRQQPGPFVGGPAARATNSRRLAVTTKSALTLCAAAETTAFEVPHAVRQRRIEHRPAAGRNLRPVGFSGEMSGSATAAALWRVPRVRAGHPVCPPPRRATPSRPARPASSVSSTASRRRSTVIGRITSRYLPRTYGSRRTSSAMPQMKLAIQFRWGWFMLFGVRSSGVARDYPAKCIASKRRPASTRWAWRSVDGRRPYGSSSGSKPG